mgnify:CR=1 FL=1
METQFAPAERADERQLRRDIETLVQQPVITTLLNTASGLVGVLNEQRQLLALNDAFLRLLGVDDPAAVLGVRPGEALQCVHAHDAPGGCGTSRFCSTCGAAIAILASLETNKPEERKCIATVARNGDRTEICLRVRASPLTIQNRRYVLIFIQDITVPQRWAESERLFLHDVNNMLTGLQGAAELLASGNLSNPAQMTTLIQDICSRMARQVSLQRMLLREDFHDYQLTPETVSARLFVDSMARLFANHPIARGKELLIGSVPDARFATDVALLQRIVVNMLTNAFEATPPGGPVRLDAEAEEHAVIFRVWNAVPIPEEVALRIFQRHFSTKGEEGRGLGTFAMKLLGERVLGGQISFTSTESGGTTFRFRLPTKLIR